jgi:hypothetical protein
LATDPIPIKTYAGLAELTASRRGVSQRHRTLLHLVDGRRDVAQVRAMANQAGVPPSCFGELLTLGLIELRAATPPSPRAGQKGHQRPAPAAPSAIDAGSREATAIDSELPASRTLPPASAFLDSATGDPVAPSTWFQTEPLEQHPADEALERARAILLRTLRSEAPLAGSLTSLRLWRARSRVDLLQLMEEVEARVDRGRRSLSAALALQQARTLLNRPAGLGW